MISMGFIFHMRIELHQVQILWYTVIVMQKQFSSNSLPSEYVSRL